VHDVTPHARWAVLLAALTLAGAAASPAQAEWYIGGELGVSLPESLSNVKLTSPTLAGGVSPRTLRRDNLLLYWPLWGLDTTEPDLSANNRTGAVTDTTFHPHAPVPPTFFARPRSVSQTAPYQPAAVLQNYRRRRAA